MKESKKKMNYTRAANYIALELIQIFKQEKRFLKKKTT